MKTRYAVSNGSMTVPAVSARDATKLAREWAVKDQTSTVVVLDNGIAIKAMFWLGASVAERGQKWLRQINAAVAAGVL